MKLPIFLVDTFTDTPFSGNPATVCILPKPFDANWMQLVAKEISQCETAFLWRQTDSFSLRWFTATTEIDGCGHATLASAYVLWEYGFVDPKEIVRFNTKSGLLTAAKKSGWIELDFPPNLAQPADGPEDLIEGLGVKPVYVGRTPSDYLVVVDSAATVRNVVPDFDRLSKLSTEGIIITSIADSNEYDFISRCFEPSIGINEDPVCGIAHCCLGPYWAEKLGKHEFAAYQASQRGGVVRVRWDGYRVYLMGKATTILRGELTIA